MIPGGKGARRGGTQFAGGLLFVCLRYRASQIVRFRRFLRLLRGRRFFGRFLMATLMIVVISDAKFHFRKLSSSSTAAHAHTCVLDSPEFIYNEMTDFFSGVSGGLLPVVEVGFFFRSSHSATQV